MLFDHLNKTQKSVTFKLLPSKIDQLFNCVPLESNNLIISTDHRPFKQMIERLNRTYKASYRHTNGFDNIEGNYNLALWVAYYNFLRPHKHNEYQVLNKVEMLEKADNMPAKWQQYAEKRYCFTGAELLSIEPWNTAADGRAGFYPSNI